MSWTAEIETAFGSPPEQGYGPPTVDVAAASWAESLLAARDGLGCRFFDFLTAVDLLEEGFSVVAHIAARQVGNVASVMLRTRLPRDEPRLDCVCGVYAGAGWHERETHEMFGIDIVGHPSLDPLLLPDGFDGHPLRKDFVLASRVAKAWPGAKEPGESDREAAPSRRRTRPPGVPDPDVWPQPSS
ncbi:MAG: NADH-quinone oxidoreductase subunit [Nocardioidaceae bacterium]|nr:NADH-quinone oxidoreductase subunit [Nocardioidaceae bacterium]MDX6307552.1 NADH-quinone oxidoreductase subunit [Nocardioidaceae bacterium]